MNDDALMRSIFGLTCVVKAFEQFRILASEERDGRYNGWITQAYGLIQDIQDKIREERVDGPIQIGSVPNLPPNNANGNQNPNPNGVVAANPVSNGGTTIPNTGGTTVPNTGGATQQQVADFFSQVLAGKTNTNGDLDDLLNQFVNAQAQSNGQSTSGGTNQANF